MSAWRRKALELLPELRLRIESSNSPGELWDGLHSIFEESIKSNNEKMTSSIIKYLTWCTSEEAGDVSNETHQAVYCGFLEDITQNRKHFPLFKNWFNTVQFEEYKGSFQYTLSEKEFEMLENDFYEK